MTNSLTRRTGILYIPIVGANQEIPRLFFFCEVYGKFNVDFQTSVIIWASEHNTTFWKLQFPSSGEAMGWKPTQWGFDILHRWSAPVPLFCADSLAVRHASRHERTVTACGRRVLSSPCGSRSLITLTQALFVLIKLRMKVSPALQFTESVRMTNIYTFKAAATPTHQYVYSLEIMIP